MSDPFWTTVTSATISGAIGGLGATFFANVWTNRTVAKEARKRLLHVLHAETNTAMIAVQPILEAVEETLDYAAKLRDHVAAGKAPDFSHITELYAGWVVFVPSYSVPEISVKLEVDEIKLVIVYFDYWSRLMEMERRYAATHSALLGCIASPLPCVQMTELAHQLHGYLVSMGQIAKHLMESAQKLQTHVGRTLNLPRS